MIPVTLDEILSSLFAQHYPMIRTLVSVAPQGINLENEQLNWPDAGAAVIPDNLRGIFAAKPTLKRLLGYEPFLSATVNNDLDNQVADATIRLHLGTGEKNLAPYMGGPSWDWAGASSGQEPYRPLLDTGVYLQLQAKCVSRTPRIVIPPAPSYVLHGPVATTAGAGLEVKPQWPTHQRNHVGILWVVTAGETATLSTPAGFQLMGAATVGTPGAATSVRLALYWCRATSSNMASPGITNPGDFVWARISGYEGCATVGNPYDSAPVFSTSGSSTSVSFPALTITSERNLVVLGVAGSADVGGDQLNGGISLYPVPNSSQPLTVRFDGWRATGSGGGLAIADGVKRIGGDTGTTAGGTATLLSAQSQVRVAFALKPRPVTAITDDPDSVPWRPFFTGRIDSAVPSRSQVDTLELRLRDFYCDLVDDVMLVPGESGRSFDPEDIQTLLQLIFDSHEQFISPDVGLSFATVGDPGMILPETFVANGKSIAQAMRDYALQNGWDLRGRFGTSPYGTYQYVYTYYEPDRARAGGQALTLATSRYFTLGGLGKDRAGVRNYWVVIPAEDRDNPAIAEAINSQIKYGKLKAAINEDESSLILTYDQAIVLATAANSDTSEPKITAEAEIRFFPWVEINDRFFLNANNVNLSSSIEASVSGYTHNIPQRGMAKTILRLRNTPAAANREWRKKSGAKKQFIKASQPVGSAADGARWFEANS